MIFNSGSPHATVVLYTLYFCFTITLFYIKTLAKHILSLIFLSCKEKHKKLSKKTFMTAYKKGQVYIQPSLIFKKTFILVILY